MFPAASPFQAAAIFSVKHEICGSEAGAIFTN